MKDTEEWMRTRQCYLEVVFLKIVVIQPINANSECEYCCYGKFLLNIHRVGVGGVVFSGSAITSSHKQEMKG
jgi:hypothetical protein